MRTMRNNRESPDNSVSAQGKGCEKDRTVPLGRTTWVMLVNKTSQKPVFPGFSPLYLFKYPQISPVLPKYAQIPPSLLEGNQWCSWARSPFQWAKGGAR